MTGESVEIFTDGTATINGETGKYRVLEVPATFGRGTTYRLFPIVDGKVVFKLPWGAGGYNIPVIRKQKCKTCGEIVVTRDGAEPYCNIKECRPNKTGKTRRARSDNHRTSQEEGRGGTRVSHAPLTPPVTHQIFQTQPVPFG